MLMFAFYLSIFDFSSHYVGAGRVKVGGDLLKVAVMMT